MAQQSTKTDAARQIECLPGQLLTPFVWTINRLGLPSKLGRCLGTTHILDNGNSALRDRVRRVKNWQSGSMALRWTAAAFDAIAQGFRRFMGYKPLWMHKAALDEPSKDRSLVEQATAG